MIRSIEQLDIFNAKESERLKQEGMRIAAANREEMLKIARSYAEGIAIMHPNRLCTADDVGRRLKAHGYMSTLGPGMGSLFRYDRWEWTGEFVKSKRITNHSHIIRVWRLRDD